MSVRSGHKTSREFKETYNGYSIIKVTEIEYERSIFDPSRYSSWPKRKEVHFDFCKEGDEKKPSQHYGAWASNVAECKECIDNFIKDDSIYFTAEEREKYVYRPNRKCDWGYGYDSLIKLMRQHQKADKRMQWLLEERLHDANFHTEGDILSTCDYEVFEDYCAQQYAFKEKFEVITRTKRKPIKDPETLVEGMNKVIADYLASQGIKDTSVNVRFIENW